MTRIRLACATLLVAALAHAQVPDCLTYSATTVPIAVIDPPVSASLVMPAEPDLLVLAPLGGLRIVDVADPSAPAMLAEVAFGPGDDADGLAVAGHHVYFVGCAAPGILDIADPAAPVVVGSLPSDSQRADVRGGLLAIGRSDQVALYSLADPAAPQLLGSIPAPGGTRPVFLADQQLALLGGGVTIYDVTAPAAPQVVVSHDIPEDYGWDTRATEITTWDGGFLVVVDRYDENHQFGHFHTRRLYLPDGEGGLDEVASVPIGQESTVASHDGFPFLRVGEVLLNGRDVLDPGTGSIEALARIPSEQPVFGGLIAVPGGMLLVSWSTYEVYAAADLAVPNLGEVDNPDDYNFVGYHAGDVGRSLLVTHGSVQINPYLQSSVVVASDTPGGESHFVTNPNEVIMLASVHAVGREVLCRDVSGGLIHYHVQEDGSAVLGGLPSLVSSGAAEGPGTLGAIVEAEQQDEQLLIYDLADPMTPVLISSLALPFAGRPDWQDDRLLIVGQEAVGLVDLASPAQPTWLGSYAVQAARWAVFAAPDRLLIGAGGLLHLIDAGDPANLTLLASAPDLGYEDAIHPVDERGYALQDDRLAVFDLTSLELAGVVILPEAMDQMSMWNQLPVVEGFCAQWAHATPACELVVTSVEPETPAAPQGLSVHPNPFNPRASVDMVLTRGGRTTLAIHDARGRLVRRFDLGELEAGRHRLDWNGRDTSGRSLPAGVYLLRLEAAGIVSTAKAALVK